MKRAIFENDALDALSPFITRLDIYFIRMRD